MGFIGEVFSGLGNIITAPFRVTSALWLLIPLFVLWLALTIYYFRNPEKNTSYNVALSLAISMFWVLIGLFSRVFDQTPFEGKKFFVLFLFFAYAIFLGMASFRESIGESLLSKLANMTVLFVLSWILIVWVYGGLAITVATFVSSILFLGILIGLTSGLRWWRKRKGSSLGEEPVEEEVTEEEPIEEEPVEEEEEPTEEEK